MTPVAKPDQRTQAELIAADYAAMGYTHWRCGTCALEHNNLWVANNTPHCDNCGADLRPEKGFKTALEAVRSYIREHGQVFSNHTRLRIKNAAGLELVAHRDGIDIWKIGTPTITMTKKLALEYACFFGMEIQS